MSLNEEVQTVRESGSIPDGRLSGAEPIASAEKTLFSHCMIGRHGGVENGTFKANDSLKN